MQISCPRCFRIVPTEELNMQQMVGKCTQCEHVFSFREQMANLLGEPLPQEKPLDAPRPSKMTMMQDGLGLALQWRWFRNYVFLLIPFALFWNAIVFSFVVPMIALPFLGSRGEALEVTPIFNFFPIFILPHTLVGLWLIYYILCLLLNQTTIHVNQGDINVRHFPLPWLGNKTVATHQIEQLYTKENKGRRRNNDITFEVHLIDRNNQHAKLVTGLPSSEHALYVEQEIERFLGIVDRPVRGEYR